MSNLGAEAGRFLFFWGGGGGGGGEDLSLKGFEDVIVFQ